MSKTMLINTVEGQECRIAILDGDRLEELYTERASAASQVGSIYKGKVTNVEPSIQAAFVDFGGVKNGFLHISDVHSKYFPKSKDSEPVGRRSSHKNRPPIQACLKRGQEIVVQMTKQGIGTKGPTLTTYLSLPGRLLVMMPGMSHSGISRKIEDEEIRKKLKETLDQLNVPDDAGVIVRTAGMDRPKKELQRDLSYLNRLWKEIKKRSDQSKAPDEIYQESDLVVRTIRDVYDSDITRIVCDRQEDGVKVLEFLDLAVPRAKCQIDVYTGQRGLFEEFGVEDEIQKIHSRQVELEKGGSLVIDQTEALVAIDVNSGSFRAHKDSESNALELNLMAAEEIGRQLRLRDMGGVIVIDFVDLRQEKNRRKLEKKVRDVLKTDRAKSKVLKISSFGLIEMTRQRLRPSLKQSLYSRCTHCDGSGSIMSRESVALRVMRDLQLATANDDIVEIEIGVCPEVAEHLANELRQEIADLERQTQRSIIIKPTDTLSGNDVELTCRNSRGSEVNWDSPGKGKKHKPDPGDFEDIHVMVKKSGKGGRKKADDFDDDTDQNSDDASSDETNSGEEGKDEDAPPKKKRRRGRRGGRKHKKKSSDDSDQKDQSGDSDDGRNDSADTKDTDSSSKKSDKGSADKSDDQNKDSKDEGQKGDSDESAEDDQKKKKSSRRRRGGRRRKKSGEADSGKTNADDGKSDSSDGRDSKSDGGQKNSSRGGDKSKSDNAERDSSSGTKDSSADSSSGSDQSPPSNDD